MINICTVKGDNTALGQIKKLKKNNPDKKLVVAGYIPRHIIPKIKEISPHINLINTYNLRKINEVVKNTLKSQSQLILSAVFRQKQKSSSMILLREGYLGN